MSSRDTRLSFSVPTRIDMKNKNKDTTTAPAMAFAIPTLADISAMEPTARIALYQRCDSELRSRFLTQGKILHSIEGGEDALRKAGVPSSSLSNARLAAIALSLVDGLNSKPVMIWMPSDVKGKGKAVEFTEAVYDQLTLEQCRLLTCAFTARGNITHRPPPDTALAILKAKEWDVELEHYFEHGMTRAMKKATEDEIAKRAKQLTTTIPPVASDDASVASAPPAPVIVSAPPKAVETPPEGGTTSGESSPSNVVPFAPAEGAETVQETADPGFTLEAWMHEFSALDTMSGQLAPGVTGTDYSAMSLMLRDLADKLEATALARTAPAEQPKAAKSTSKKPSKKPGKATKAA